MKKLKKIIKEVHDKKITDEQAVEKLEALLKDDSLTLEAWQEARLWKMGYENQIRFAQAK